MSEENIYATREYKDLRKHCAVQVVQAINLSTQLIDMRARGPFMLDVISDVASAVLSTASSDLKMLYPEIVETICASFAVRVYEGAGIRCPQILRDLATLKDGK